MHITTIISDFGDVLVKDTVKALEHKYDLRSLAPGKQKKYIRALHAAEIGKISTQQFASITHATLAPDLQPAEIIKFIATTHLLPPWEILHKLAACYQIIIFSNNQSGFPKIIGEKLKINFFVYPFINSSKIKLRKPFINSYKYVLKKYKLKAQETIFIDDKERNILPAKHLGLHTFHYTNNPGELKKFLKSLKIKGL